MEQNPPRLTRRDFVRLGATSAATVLVAACVRDLALPGGASEAGSAALSHGSSGTVTRYPLRIPPTASPGGLTLTAAPATVDIGGQTANAWVYNGAFPGPTLVARTGERAGILLRNGLPEQTITHWHGLLVETADDGQPHDAIGPGATYAYDYPIFQRAGLNFYHPHPHHLTGRQVGRGLAGAFIIRDAEEDALGLPSGAYEVPLVLRAASIENGMVTGGDSHSGSDELLLVNGTRNPYLEVDTALYRFRVLNNSNAAVFTLSLSNGGPFILIGNDGGLLETASQHAQITLAPAERLDLLVDFRQLAVGASVMLRTSSSGERWSSSAVDALEFRVARQVSVPAAVPSQLSTIPRLSSPAATREFRFGWRNTINGREYDMSRTDFTVPYGRTELWRFIADGGAPHPVHVHGTSFQVVARRGGRNQVFAWERGWKDTVLLQDNETVDVLIRFDHAYGGVPYRGRYVMHCHRLEHEDAGMMMNFVVV